jgi:hypothetical protein
MPAGPVRLPALLTSRAAETSGSPLHPDRTPSADLGVTWFWLVRRRGRRQFDKFSIRLTSGTNNAITMKPTAPPRNRMSSGSISFVRPSVSTATSSS